jgi:acetyltransferase-like isoleucine patch superfamily enzyme
MDTRHKATSLLRVITTNPSELWRVLRIRLASARYRYLTRCVGQGTVVGVRTEIINAANVRIGRDCVLQDDLYLRAGTEGRITIGDRATLDSFCRLFGHGAIDIGADTQIGPGCLITTTDHDYGDNLTVRFKRVSIGQRVWIGANVTILPGVEIGDGAVVEAGSVVMKSLPPGCVALGVPARVVKRQDQASAPAGEGTTAVSESET